MPAQAESVGEITRLDVRIELAQDGTGQVEWDFDYDFGTEAAHGPFLLLATRQEIPDDPDHYRMYEISNIRSASDSGAPAASSQRRDGGVIELRIGDEDVEVSGVQHYRVRYSITGLLNSETVGGPEGQPMDELYWNVVAPGGFDVPISNISVAVTAPEAGSAATCYAGPGGATDRCDGVEDDDGGEVTLFRQGRLAAGEALSVVVGWPAGTFHDIEPVLAHRRTFANTVQLTPATGTVSLLATIAALWATSRIGRRRDGDDHFAGITPGLLPAEGQQVQVKRGSILTNPAVRFTPPKDMRPAEAATMIGAFVQNSEVVATIIDLAVRGHLRIEKASKQRKSGKDGNWRLVRLTGDTTGLRSYEVRLLGTIFAEGQRISTHRMGKEKRYAKAHDQARDDIYAGVVDRGWVRRNPRRTRKYWGVRLVVVAFVSIALSVLVLISDWPAVYVVPLFAAMLRILWHMGTALARTAAGSAATVQALGYRKYLKTAEAAQLRFAEERAEFVDALPWAIAYQLTTRWSRVFQELVDDGYEPQVHWFVPAAGVAGGQSIADLTDELKRFATTAASTLGSATGGAAGGSGFSGSAGGGTGGTGGGSW